MQEGKVVSWGGFTIAEKKREVKGKEEKERYTQLNTGFQKMARRDKKASLNKQYKEIEENNRVGKTNDVFKKIGDIKGRFHVRMGTIRDRNSNNLTETEEIRRGGKDTENYTKMVLMTWIMMMVWSWA